MRGGFHYFFGSIAVLVLIFSHLPAASIAGTVGMDAVQVSGPEWGDAEGGIAGPTELVIYDNRVGNLFFVANNIVGAFVEDLHTLHLNGDTQAGPGAWVSRVEFGLVSVVGTAQTVDAAFDFWNVFDDDGLPGGEPVHRGLEGGFRAEGLVMPGAAAYQPRVFFADLANLPGGGVFVSDDLTAVRFSIYAAGTNTLQSNVRQLWSANGDIGWSADDFFCDTGPQADMDGTVEAGERYYFGGSEYVANFYLKLTACIPCDTNCDGTVNPFDIQSFIGLLSNTSGPCSACAGDANGDGTTSPFDIQTFLRCLGA